jgi:very-short-patch-repair endonuclease
MGVQNRNEPADVVIGRAAERQYGVVARRQLLAAGLSPKAVEHRLRAGRLIVLHRGVYAVGHRRLTRDGHGSAAVLAAGPGAVLSHRDAAALHGLGHWRVNVIEVTTAADVRSTAAVRVHARRLLTADDVTTAAGIPVTSVARTLVDLAEVVNRERLAEALTAAERAQTLDLQAVLAARERVLHRHGRGDVLLRAVLAEYDRRGAQLTREELERRLRRLVRVHRLGRPRLNAWIEGVEVDAYWPAARLVVETDGWEWHRDRASFERDRDKTNRLQLAGYIVLRFTHRAVLDHPAEVAAAIRAVLAR